MTQNFPKIVAKEENIEDYRSALNTLNNTALNNLRAEANELLQLGAVELKGRNYDKAHKFFEASKNRLPNPQAWFFQGLTNYERDNLARAVEEFSAAILMYENDEQASNAYYYRARSIFEILINT